MAPTITRSGEMREESRPNVKTIRSRLPTLSVVLILSYLFLYIFNLSFVRKFGDDDRTKNEAGRLVDVLAAFRRPDGLNVRSERNATGMSFHNKSRPPPNPLFWSKSAGVDVNESLGVVETNVELGSKLTVASSVPVKLKLQEILDEIFIFSGRQATGDIWEHSAILPNWIKEYSRWHKLERAKVEVAAGSTRFLVMRCLAGKDAQCGGTSDRLKPFLLMARLAYEQHRLLIIHWTRPCHLQEFLLPPVGGVDWRAPPWLVEQLDGPDNFRRPMNGFVQNPDRFKKEPIVVIRFQSMTGGKEHYDKLVGVQAESDFFTIYHDAWRIFFTPSPPVAKLITSEMNSAGLVPGRYSAAHLRANYGEGIYRPIEQTRNWTQNSINCASWLFPGGPFFFASDTSDAIPIARLYGQDRGVRVVSRKYDKEPLHLDKALGWADRPPSDFYDTFVDLYMLGLSRCVTYNRGGYGHWGRLLSFNASCYKNQKSVADRIKKRCNWTESSASNTSIKTAEGQRAPLFLPPMDE